MSHETFMVVVWGDSVAAGTESQQWPALAERVCNVTCNIGRTVKVVNEGVQGKSAAAARGEFEQRVLPYNPDLVIIQFGFNDLRYDGSRENLPISTPLEFSQHLRAMITDCTTRANASVAVFGNHRIRMHVLLPDGQTCDEAREAYNQAARRAAAAARATYHDLETELTGPELDWTELICENGVSLSPVGFYAYAHYAANVIQATTARRRPAPAPVQQRRARERQGPITGWRRL